MIWNNEAHAKRTNLDQETESWQPSGAPRPISGHCAYAIAKTCQKDPCPLVVSESEEKRDGDGKATRGGPSYADSQCSLSSENRGLKLLLDVSNAKRPPLKCAS